jgi:hypothetical protein
MKSVFLGWPVSFDSDKSDPAVTVNGSGGVTLTHLQGSDLYYRFGTFNEATMNWRGFAPVPYSGVQSADVANNTIGVLLAIEGATQFSALPGRYTPEGVSWGQARLIDSLSIRPSVGMNEAGLFLIAYQGGLSINYASGTSDGLSVDSTGHQTLPQNGTRPSVALNNRNETALAYEDGDSIYLLLGTLSQGLLHTTWMGEVAKKGSEPSVTLTDDGVVIVTFEAEDEALLQLVLLVANGVPLRIQQRFYATGHSSSVAASGTLALEVHQNGSSLYYANSLVTDRENWMSDRLAKIGGVPLNKLILPASHDSGMYRVSPSVARPWGRTQSESTRRQLEDGIRWFDYRPRREHSHIVNYHGESDGPRLAELIADLKAFIESGRNELILVRFSHFRDFQHATWHHFVDQMKALDRWMFKRTNFPPGKSRLRDVTLAEYLGSGARLLVLTTRLHESMPDGYWLARGDEDDSAAGDLRIFDHYSGTEDFNEMRREQLDMFARYTGKCEDGSDCDLFLFSWTLTPTPSITDPVPSPVISLAKKANPFLGQTVAEAIIPNAQGQIMNLLYVDFAEAARACDVALYQLGVPTP